jgi:LPS-assembly lipoprotein
MRRRTLIALAPAAAATLTAALTAGCGFTLRRAPELPFKRIALLGFAKRSTLVEELRRQLPATVTVVDTPGQAEVVLQAINEARGRSVVASTAAGQVRDLTLRLRLDFRVSTPGGRELIAATNIALSRDMSYNETVALSKQIEEGELYASMETDIATQLVARLARVNPGAD